MTILVKKKTKSTMGRLVQKEGLHKHTADVDEYRFWTVAILKASLNCMSVSYAGGYVFPYVDHLLMMDKDSRTRTRIFIC